MADDRFALLERVVAETLPLVVTDAAEIDQVRSYVAAGFVEADLPAAEPRRLNVCPPASVRRVTPEGYRAVEAIKANRSLSRRRLMR